MMGRERRSRMPDWKASLLRLVVITLLAASTISAQSSKSALLPQKEAQSVTRLCSRGGPGKVDGSWEPTKADLQLLESRLSKIQIKNPESYYRQYVAIMVKGRKLIYINGLCTNPPSNWRNKLTDVCDGGDCFWGVIYDPDTGKFSDLQVNGVA